MVKAPPAKLSNSANGHRSPECRPREAILNQSALRHLAASLKRQWKRYRKGLKRCQERFSERAVHESRVETRRLLSLLDLLRPLLRRGEVNRAQTALKKHLDTFDDLRDTQVQLLAVRKLRRLFAAGEPFYEYLLKREQRFRRETRADIKRVKTGRLGRFIDECREDMREWRDRASGEEVNALLLGSVDTAFARALELRRQIRPRETEGIHRTRVAFKKLRYMIETLAEHLPADENLLVAMHRYQTMMGDIQDAEVLLRSFDKFLVKKPVDLTDARRLRRELLRRRQWLIRVYLDAADQLSEFWRLEDRRRGRAGGSKVDGDSGTNPRRPGSRRALFSKRQTKVR